MIFWLKKSQCLALRLNQFFSLTTYQWSSFQSMENLRLVRTICTFAKAFKFNFFTTEGPTLIKTGLEDWFCEISSFFLAFNIVKGNHIEFRTLHRVKNLKFRIFTGVEFPSKDPDSILKFMRS